MKPKFNRDPEVLQPNAKTIPNVLSVTVVLFVVFYIVFSIIKRLFDDKNLFWFPLVLFGASFMILLEMLYWRYTKKLTCSRRDFGNLLLQLVLNLAGALLALSYIVW